MIRLPRPGLAWCDAGVDVEDLRALVALSRAGRFTAAARALGWSQPTFSRRIQALEREVGMKLVVRTAGGAVLTEPGEKLLAHVERALASLDSGLTELAELAGVPKGQVALGTLPTVAVHVLPPIVARFHRKHPDVRILVREGFSGPLQDLVARGELDMAIVHHPVRREELSERRLFREDYLLAVPPRHRLARAKKPVALASVATEPFVVIPGAPAMAAIEAACAARKVRPVVALETDNLESVRRMVEAGLGIALVPRMMTRDRRRWRAEIVELVAGSVTREIAIVHRGAGYLGAAARLLREAIVDATRG